MMARAGAIFRSSRPSGWDGLIFTLILFVAIVAAFPLVWMLLSSFKTPAESMQTPPVWIPASPDFSAYREVADVIDASRSFWNSFVIATCTTAGILVTSLMAGATLAVLPPLVLFVFLQRFFVDSIVSAGVKG